jgi:hypothetical protein
MKKILLFLLLFLVLYSVNAQEYQYVPFPDSNAVWSEVYWKPDFQPCPSWVYHKYALFNEDTVMNGLIYHKLFHTNASAITKENAECIGGIREDSLRRIWLYCFSYPYTLDPLFFNYEIKLCDFNISVGDTITNIVSFLGESLVVKQIDSIIVNNTVRKVYSFETPSWVYWIEGIGNVKGLIFPSGDLPNNGMDNDLICFHQNDTLLYFNTDYDGCVPSFVLDGVPILVNSDVRVYPNPVTGQYSIFEGLNFETLEIFDEKGNKVYSASIKGFSTYTLDVSQFPQGVYIYQLKTKGLLSTTGKLIIQ